MTNRDIAQSLFVTPKTVEVHLSSAYRKLDIGSRTQLAAVLGQAASGAGGGIGVGGGGGGVDGAAGPDDAAR